jgi:predicted RNA binding protein YcfA (HicA-like mRNA interferase family)
MSKYHPRLRLLWHTNKDIPTGTLYAILKQAGIEKEEI